MARKKSRYDYKIKNSLDENLILIAQWFLILLLIFNIGFALYLIKIMS